MWWRERLVIFLSLRELGGIVRGRPKLFYYVSCSVRYLSLGDFLAWHDLTALRLVRWGDRSSPWGLNGDLAEDEDSTANSLPL